MQASFDAYKSREVAFIIGFRRRTLCKIKKALAKFPTRPRSPPFTLWKHKRHSQRRSINVQQPCLHYSLHSMRSSTGFVPATSPAAALLRSCSFCLANLSKLQVDDWNMASSAYTPPFALTIISRVSLGVAVLASLWLTSDIFYRRGWRSMMAVMYVVYSSAPLQTSILAWPRTE